MLEGRLIARAPLEKLGDDQPKTNPWTQDRLGYARFAERVANVVFNLSVPNGYVIGLHGQWGSGKSTVVNFINSYLDKYNVESEEADPKIEIVDFRPWIVAGHQDLIAAFFKVLSETLGESDGWWKRKWKGLLRTFRGTSDTLIDSLATVALGVDPSAGVASSTTGNILKRALNGPIDRFLEEPSLQGAYDKLRTQLGKTERRFLIVIDDLDRLEDAEVRLIMQMVKTVGRLPNVIYLLVYDREIVSKALDGSSTDRVGPRFAEKIVQQELDLPRPSKQSLLQILDEEIAFLTGPTEDSARWQYLVRDGVRRWVRSPRDVLRLSNAVKFSWSALRGEIDPQDLVAIEGLRLFDEGAFYWVRDNRDFLFNEGRFVLSTDDVKKEAAGGLKGRISPEKLSEVLRVVSVLFPRATKWLEESDFGSEDQIEVDKRRGIGSEAGYDTYFGLHPSSDAIPKSTIDAMFANLDDKEALDRVFRTYLKLNSSRGDPMVTKLLDELRIRFRGGARAQPTQALLDTLFAHGDAVLAVEKNDDLFELSARAQINFLIRNMLEVWGPGQAAEHLIEAFERSDSSAFCANVYVDRGRELGVFRSDSSERPTITPQEFDRLGAILLSKLMAAASTDELASAPYYFDIVRSWRHLAGDEPVKEWLRNGIQGSSTFYVRLARGMVSYTLGTKTRRYSPGENFQPDLIDPGQLLAAGERHLADSRLSDDERRLIQAVLLGARRIQSGQRPDNAYDGIGDNED